MKKLLIVLAVFAISLIGAIAQEKTKDVAPKVSVTPEYHDVAIKLFKALGYSSDYESIITGTLRRVQMYKPEVKDEYWDEVRKNMEDKEYFNDIVLLYAEVFNLSEIKELVGFYESAVFKKMSLLDQGFQVKLGEIQEKYYDKVVLRVAQKMKKDGHELPKFMIDTIEKHNIESNK